MTTQTQIPMRSPSFTRAAEISSNSLADFLHSIRSFWPRTGMRMILPAIVALAAAPETQAQQTKETTTAHHCVTLEQFTGASSGWKLDCVGSLLGTGNVGGIDYYSAPAGSVLSWDALGVSFIAVHSASAVGLGGNGFKAAFGLADPGGDYWSFGACLGTPCGGISAAFGSGSSWDWATTALGESTNAWTYATFAAGSSTLAQGAFSTALGTGTTATGEASLALGDHTVAAASAGVALGRFNVGSTANGATAWVAGDPIFEIGNGTGPDDRSNALTVYKNGSATLQGVAHAAPGGEIPTLPQP